MTSVTKGIVLVIGSALIYGFTPILARITYDGGSNGVTMTFLRAVLALPIVGIILKCMNVPFSVTRRQVCDLMVSVGIGSGVTTILLYLSYAYIPVGMATTLHFIYPVVVSVACAVFFREKMSAAVLFALAISIVGVVLTADRTSAGGGSTGMLLAVASGFTFAYYVIRLDKSDLRTMHFFKLSFYTCVTVGIVSGAYGLATNTLSFDLTAEAWTYSWIVSLCTSVGAVTMLQQGIRMTGATRASILSTFEPVTSVLLGALILQETLSLPKMIGGACIIASVLVITMTASSRPCGEAP